MAQTVITKAFTEWKAQQAIDNQPVNLDEFIFAYIPDLDVTKPVENTEGLPPADKIVHRQAVSKSGVVNANSVVYSVTLGADVGDFNFNWIGLANKETGTLAMIIHAPTQSKIKNASGQQGNVLVRSMLMEYSGAESATNITTPAETWQIDFTARLAAMDERQRRENIDLYGMAAFFDSGYLVAKSGAQYYVTKGAGYVAGLRTELAANQNITVSTRPVKVWLDVSWSGTLTSEWAIKSKITVAASLADYVENGSQHYVFAVASIDASGNITDLRPKGSLNDQAIKEHEKSRNHPDATTTAKGFTQLSSATDSESEVLAATPKAVKAVSDDVKTLKESLGDAAFRNVADNAPGALIPVGYKGNFKSECNHGAIDFATYPFVVGESLFVDSRGCTNPPSFLTQDFYYINVVCATSPAQGGRVNRPLIQFVSYTNSTMIFAIREDDGSTIGWRYFRAVQFDADNQHVTFPGDVRARNGAIELSQSAIIIRGSGNKHLWFFNASGAEMGLVYASDDKVLHLRAGEGPSVNIQSNGNVVAPNYLEAKDDIHSGRNISSVGLIQAGAGLYDTPGVRVYSPNYMPTFPVTSVNGMQGAVVIPEPNLDPYVKRDSITYVGLAANSTAYPYMRHADSDTIVYLAPSDWVRSNFIQGVRKGAKGSANSNQNSDRFARAPDGASVVSVYNESTYIAIEYRYDQYNINGNWYNVGAL